MSDLRALGPWYLAEGLNSYAVTLLTSGAYWYAERELHARPDQRLWLAVAWGFAYIFFALMGGRMAERWGVRRTALMMISGCTITALVGLSAIWASSLRVLVIAMLGYNFTSTQIWPAIESAVTRTPGKMRLSNRLTMYNLVWALAGFMAFLTVGSIARIWWGLIFAVPAVASAIASAVLATLAVPESMIGKQHVPDEPGAEHELDDPMVRRRAQALLLMAWVANALAYMAINVLIPVMPTLVKNAGVLGLQAGTAVGSLWGLARFAGFGLTWFWKGWHYSVRWLVATQVVLSGTFFVLLYFGALPVGVPWKLAIFLVVQLAFGLATALIYASSLYYAMHVSRGAGGHAGIHEALIGAGICVGPMVGALAGTGLDAVNRIAFAVTGLLMLGVVLMVIMGLRRGRSASR